MTLLTIFSVVSEPRDSRILWVACFSCLCTNGRPCSHVEKAVC